MGWNSMTLEQQEAANEKARLDWLKKPIHEKPLTAACLPTARKYSYCEETAKHFMLDEGTGLPLIDRQLPIEELRKQLRDSHPDYGGNPEEFHRLKMELDARRGRK
jgi:hypothetical protein